MQINSTSANLFIKWKFWTKWIFKVEIFLEQREVVFLSPSKICENSNFSTEIQICENFCWMIRLDDATNLCSKIISTLLSTFFYATWINSINAIAMALIDKESNFYHRSQIQLGLIILCTEGKVISWIL